MDQQLELFGRIDRLLMDEAITIFHNIEGKHKGRNYHYQYKPIRLFFKGRYLDEVNEVDVKNYREARKNDGLKPSGINREHSVITRLFNAFKEWRGLKVVGPYNLGDLQLPAENPGEQVKKADERPFTRTLVLTPMEFYKFCDYAHPNVRIICIMAVLTLLRRKNLVMLNKTNFNAAFKQIQAEQTKTKLSVTVPTTQTVTFFIEQTKYDCVCDFTNFRRLFERARRESGVQFQFRDLRRTGATQLILDGVDLRTIQKYLGHTSLVMTERYLQPPAQHMIDAGKKLEEKFGSLHILNSFQG